MSNLTKVVTFCDFPQSFPLDDEGYNKLLSSYHFDHFNIRTVLSYSNYIGVENTQQRLFSIIFMRQMPRYILGEGSIELDFDSNRLTVYIVGEKPIIIAQIE